jgi:hypothetical protein
LSAHKVENVMLVSAFLAAAALAQSVGNETNYAQTALLFIEPDTATLAIVDTADGSIADVHRQALPEDDDAAVAQLATMVSEAEALGTRPGAVFVVGSGVDIPLIKPALEAATTLPLAMPEEPETALARGAALASANAPLFVSSTVARAYAQDPGTGTIDPFAIAPGYFDIPDSGEDALAYSAVPEDYADTYTGAHTAATELAHYREHRSFGLVGSAVAAVFIVGVAALVVSLAIAIRPTAGVKPVPGQNVVAPAQGVPVPAAPAPAAPAPEAAPIPTPAPVPQAPAHVPVPEAPAPVPVQLPAAPAPVAPAPAAPIPIPIPLPIPPIIGVPGGPLGPGGGEFPGNPGHEGGGHGGGGFPGFGGGHGGGGFPGGGGGHGGFGGGHGGGGHR